MVFALNQDGAAATPWEPSFELAEAGFRLFNNLLPSEDETARKIRRWLEDLRKQSGLIGLEVVVEERSADAKAFLSMPWNLVYDERPAKYKAAFQKGQGVERWRPFWSARYNLTSGRRVEPLKRLPLWSDPRVVVVVDPTVHEGLNDEQKQRLDQFLAEAGLTAVGSMDELEAALEEGYPRLLYWLGHATPDYLMLGDERIAPGDLRNLLRSFDDRERPEGMLAFLNACQTAEAGSSGSFLDVLHSFGFTGAIATERQTIDTFANEFGLAFLRGFLREGKPLGELLHGLRLQSAPLGLLYGAHCPPEIRVRSGNGAPDVPAPLPIRESGPVAGIALGAATLPADGPATATADRTRDMPIPAACAAAPRRAVPLAGLLRREGSRPVHRPRRRRRAVRRDARPARHADPDPARRERHRQDLVPPRRGHPLPGRGVRRLPLLPPARRRVADRPGRQGPGRPDCSGACSMPRRRRCATTLRTASRSRWTSAGCSTRPSGRTADYATLREALGRDVHLLADLLARMAGRLPHALVLVLDQAEEVFTLARTPEEVAGRDHGLRMLQRLVDVKADVKLIVSLRTEYYGRLLDHLRAGRRDLIGVRDDLLRDFSRDRPDRGDHAADVRHAAGSGPASAPPEIRLPLRRGHRGADRRRCPGAAVGEPGRRLAAGPGHLHPALRTEADASRARTGSSPDEDLDAIKGVEGGLYGVRGGCAGAVDGDSARRIARRSRRCSVSSTIASRTAR